MSFLNRFLLDRFKRGVLNREDIDGLGSSDFTGKILEIKPYKEGGGIESGSEFIREVGSYDDPETKNRIRKVESRAFELWYKEDNLRFIFYVKSRMGEERLRGALDSCYPKCSVEEIDEIHPLDRDKQIVGGKFQLDRHNPYPIRHHSICEDGFNPFKKLSSTLRNIAGEVWIQVLYVKSSRDWDRGWFKNSTEKIVEKLESKKLKRLGGLIAIGRREAFKEEREDARRVIEKSRDKLFRTEIRYFISGMDPERIADTLSKKIEYIYDQERLNSLKTINFTQKEIKHKIQDGISRRWKPNSTVLSAKELSGLSYIPNKNIKTEDIDWTNNL